MKKKISDVLTTRTDSLYTIKYDSLFFDELKGEAFIKNIRITGDTVKVKNKDPYKIPYVILDIAIKSITIKGVKTDKALLGQQMIGDSVIIDEPKITAYFLKSIRKETKVDAEAKHLYSEILGKVSLIQVGEVIVRNAEIHAINFANYERQFDLSKTTIQLHDVKIDSLHNEDTSRILFCRDATFHVDNFTAFNNNRSMLMVNDIAFAGKERRLTISQILLNRFEDATSSPISLCAAENMLVSGINTFEVVKNKSIVIDSIFCKHISFYRPPSLSLNAKHLLKEHNNPKDSTGFRSVYSVEVNSLNFPDIDIIEINPPASRTNFKLGKLALKIKSIEADPLLHIEVDPLSHAKEFDLSCNNISYNSPDNVYHYNLQNIGYNSLRKQFYVGNFKITPALGEAAFAQRQTVQKDRYDINMSGINLNDVNLDHLLKKELFANAVTVNSSSIKIYRDISHRIEPVSKVGKYPHQMLMKSDMPIDVKHVTLNNVFLEYKEKNAISDSAGRVRFLNTKIDINNVTNVTSSLAKNNICTANFSSNVLGKLPLTATFKFFLTGENGKFAVDGALGEADAKALNTISIPMALIKIDTGIIHSANFNFTGNDFETDGEFVMKYNDLKIALLKKDAETNVLKKRGIMSMLANTLVKNSNPANGKLRSITVHYNRDKYKSFFNLVWKTIFTGMQGTVGIPLPKIKEGK